MFRRPDCYPTKILLTRDPPSPPQIIDRRRGNDPNKVVKQGRRGAAREGIFSYDAFLQDVGLAPAGAGAGAGMGELEDGGVKEEEKPRVGAPLAEEMDAVDYGDL